MFVNNVYLTKVEVGQPETAPTAAEVGRGAGRADLTAEVSSHVPSSDLLRMLTLLGQEPEVRQERVLQAQERLSAGYYLTPEAAEKTAEAIRHAAE